MANNPNPYYQDLLYVSSPQIPGPGKCFITAPTLAQQFVPDSTNFPCNYGPSGDNKYPYSVWIYGTKSLNDTAQAIPITNGVPGQNWSIDIIANLANVLASTLGSYQGTGIAANQVGILWRMFLVDQSQFPNGLVDSSGQTVPSFPYPSETSKSSNNGAYYLFINPEMTFSDTTKTWQSQEECLSIPCLPSPDANPVLTERYQQFTCTFYTLTSDSSALEQFTYNSTFTQTGQPSTNSSTNAANWVLQHETNHLDGILYVQKSTGIKGDLTYLTTLAAGWQNGVIQQPPSPPPLPLGPGPGVGPIVHH